MSTSSDENAAQIEHWSGTAGERWRRYQALMDAAIGPLGEAALAAAAPRAGEHVLDVGCGCGDSVLALADKVGPSGRVTGVDVSQPMLARAKERLPNDARNGAPIELFEADASTAPLPRVDLVFSRFGVMFFADPVRAFAHLRDAVTPGGRLAFVCWRARVENTWARIPAEAIERHLPPEPPADPLAPGPFAFADRSRLESILGRAGWSDITITPHDARLRWAHTLEEALDLSLHIGPAARRIAEADPAAQARATAAMAQALEARLEPTGVLFDAAVWIATATSRGVNPCRT